LEQLLEDYLGNPAVLSVLLFLAPFVLQEAAVLAAAALAAAGELPTAVALGAVSAGMALRPSQLRAAAEESALMVPQASGLSGRYRALAMPVAVVAGEADRLVDARRQSGRLSRVLGQGRLTLVPGAGHMVHQTHTEAVLAAVEEMAGA
jgi:pimeloyl-ACP methyl ester carboxylesterase